MDNILAAQRVIHEQLLTIYKDQSILVKNLQMGMSKERLTPVDQKVLYKHYRVYIQYASVVAGSQYSILSLNEYWDVVKNYADKNKFIVSDHDIIIN